MTTNAKNFKTKIGLGFVISLPLLIFGILILCIYIKDYTALFVAIPFILVAFYTIFSICYKIIEDRLLISSGPFYKLEIPISSIYKIEETWGIIKSPAASTDRLELFYNKFDSVMISPQDKTGFISALKEINQEIEVIRKN
ncbi:hypothetical protein CNR22_17200 [Sphingobacteriaceae bacterium]|nr:hypothetical protein CNR22_17200 [Sphingobacteriaceae bacterium]